MLRMEASVVDPVRLMRSAPPGSAVASLFADESGRDRARIMLPRSEIHLVVRFGPAAENGLDVHACGARQTVRRKLIRRGQRTVMARLHLGVAEAVLGASASAMAGQLVPLAELWGGAATRQLCSRLAAARHTADAAAILESALGQRAAIANRRPSRARLALDAAEMLRSASVSAVAVDLGVSERHLRRVFREVVGVSPKAFAKLTRFQRAVRFARDDARASWAHIATAAGYYDQAHLIAEFHAISGVTPRALLRELDGAPSVD